MIQQVKTDNLYKCECGKEFTDPQAFNGHKAHCKLHHIHKYGSTEVLERHDEKCAEHSRKRNQILREKHQERKNIDLQNWVNEKHICEHCGKVMTEKFASGRFCSRACANSHKHADEEKLKISRSVKQYRNNHPRLLKEHKKANRITTKISSEDRYYTNPKHCPICGNIVDFDHRYNKTCGKTSCVSAYNSKIIREKKKLNFTIYGKNIPGRHIVYKVINNFDDRYYIGVRKCEKDESDKYLGSGIIINKMINKYGRDNFKRITLYEYNCSEDAFNKEKELLSEMLKDPNCVNLASGGQGGYTHGKLSK